MTKLDGVAVLYGGPFDGFIVADCPHHGAEVATQWEPQVDLLGRNGAPNSWELVDEDTLVVSGPLRSGDELFLRTAVYHRHNEMAWIEEHALPAYL